MCLDLFNILIPSMFMDPLRNCDLCSIIMIDFIYSKMRFPKFLLYILSWHDPSGLFFAV